MDEIEQQLEAMMQRMQSPESRKASEALSKATSEELGEAVLKSIENKEY